MRHLHQTFFDMARNTTEANVTVTLNGETARNELKKLEEELQKYKDAAQEAYEHGNKALGDKMTKNAERLAKEFSVAKKEMKDFADFMKGLNSKSLSQLKSAAAQLKSQIKGLVPGTQQFIEKSEQLKQVNTRIKQLEGSFRGLVEEEKRATFSLKGLADGFNKYFGMVTAGIAAITGVSMAFRKAAQDAAALDDIYSDVMKTTGLLHEQVVALDEELLKIDTRTSREQLLLLARDAGKLGITGKENILGFVRAADQIQVALGEDLGEGAIRNLGKISDVLGYTSSMGIEKSLLSIGSAINAVGQASTASEGYLVDFTQRMAGVAAQTGISAANIIGFASGLDQSAMKVEMASTAFQKFLMKLYEDPAKFAAYANLEVEKFSELLKTDANQAVITILKALKDQDGFASLVPIFKDMGLDGERAVSVLAAMATNINAVTDAQALANEEFAKATSVTEEYNTKNNNMQANLEKARKEFQNASIALGQSLNPIMLKTTKATTYLIKALAAYGKEIKAAIISIVALTAVIKLNAIAQGIDTAARKIANTLIKTSSVIVNLLKVAYFNLTGQTERATAAQVALNAAMSASVIGLVATAVASLTVAIVHYTKKAREASEVTKKIEEIQDRINSEYAEGASKVQVLSDIVHNNNLELEQRRQALEKLKEIIPAYHADLTKEGQLINDNTEALSLYLKNLEKVTRAKILEDEFTQATAEVLRQEKRVSDAKAEQTEALINANGNTATHTTHTTTMMFDQQQWQQEYTELTPYGEAIQKEVEATKDLTAAQQVQAEIRQRIERENGDAFATRKGELTAEELEIRTLNQEYQQLFHTIRDENRDNPEKAAEQIADFQMELQKKIAEIRQKYKDAASTNENPGGGGGGGDDKENKKAFDARIKQLQQQFKTEERELKLSLAKKEISQAEYDAKIYAAHMENLRLRLEAARQYGQDSTDIQNEFLDMQIKAIEKHQKEVEAINDAFANVERAKKKKEEEEQKKQMEATTKRLANEQEILEQDLARVKERIGEDTWKEELAFEMWKLEELHNQGIISERTYQEAKLKIKLEYAQKAANQVNQIAEMASNFVTQLKQMETAQMEAEYQAQLTAAGDNAEEREAIEAEYEQKKLDMQKKYADVDMVINIAKAIASGALAAVEAFAAAGGNPVLGGVFAAIIAATTAAEIATIVAQRNAIKNTSVGGGGSSSAPKTGERKMTGYAEGGYTEDHTTLTTVGEKGREWVGPAWMVRQNPVMFANLERYRKSGSHGRSGSMSRGFADGGFTPGKGGGPSATMPEQIDIEAAVEAAIRRSMADGAIRAFVVRKDIEELDAQTLKFKKLGSR